MRHRRLLAIAVAGFAFAALASHPPTADIRLLTHEAADPSPGRFQAAVDLGLVGVSVLYTWTVRRLP